jgi:acetyl-CoA C-acetyltransferase
MINEASEVGNELEITRPDMDRWAARSHQLAANAAKQALEKLGKSADEIDLWEINEAFASVALNSVRMLGVDADKVNVNGGAIALGHPIGASGARIVGALVHELRRRGGGLGCAAICSGGGQGDAIIVEVNGS